MHQTREFRIMTDYIVVEGNTITMLQQRVLNNLKLGYLLQGGVSVERAELMAVRIFYQAMYKP